MKKVLFLLFFASQTLFAQEFGVYVSNFSLNNKAEQWCWAINQDNDNNMLFGVSNGVVVFDGINQSLVKTPFYPKAMVFNPATNQTWVCGYQSVGVLVQKNYGQYEYKHLITQKEIDFTDLFLINDTVYAIAENQIIRLQASDYKELETIKTEGTIEHFFNFNNAPYLIVEYFLYSLKNDKIVEIASDNFPVDDYSFLMDYNKSILMGTHTKNFYVFDQKRANLKTLKSNSFFENNIITKALPYTGNLVAVSSMASGIALVDFEKSEVVKQVSFFNGLPDDEIRTLFVDRQQGVWVSHQFGISRIDFNINIEAYQFYPGLKGNAMAVKYFNNLVYVATTDGVFYLSKVNDYSEVEVKVDVPVDVTVEVAVDEPQPSNASTASSVDPSSGDSKESGGGLFSKKRKKKKDETSMAEPVQTVNQPTRTEKRVIQQLETRTIKKRSLKSISHYFQPVNGLNDKCKQLVTFKGQLLASGNNGLYHINRQQASRIINNVYVVDVYVNDELNEAYCATNNGLYKIKYSGGQWQVEHFAQTTSSYINSIAYSGNNIFTLTIDNVVATAKLAGNKIEILTQSELPEPPGRTFYVNKVKDSTYIFTSNNLYSISGEGEIKLRHAYERDIYLITNQSQFVWYYRNNNWNYFSVKNTTVDQSVKDKLFMFDNLRYIDVNENGTIWVVDEQNQIFSIGKNTNPVPDFTFTTPNFIVNDKEYYGVKSLSLPPKQNQLIVNLSAPFYLKQNGVNYSYKIQGLDNSWSIPITSNNITLKYLPSGNYKLLIKATNALGQSHEISYITVRVAKPFTQSIWFILLLLVIIGAGVYYGFKWRIKMLEKDKQILEQKVKERTQTIEEQKNVIEKHHDEVKQSIRYAQRIQQAMLPHTEIIDAVLPENFILFMPRDIVSGDFYFFKPIGKYVVYVAADCTGHGVPGAFMSMLGMSFLNEITSIGKEVTAAEILNQLRTKIKVTLGQTDKTSSSKDGMDIALMIYNTERKTMQFAGAFNPLYIVRDNDVITVKGDRQPVAVYFKEQGFTNNCVDIMPGDRFYMFSDGFADQIGGPKQRKFMSKNFKDLLVEIHKMPMAKQHETLKTTILQWMEEGHESQMDDILVIGFKLD